MKNNIANSANNIVCWLIFVAITICFWKVSSSVPMIMDDPEYAYMVASPKTDSPHGVDINTPIHNIGDAIISQYHHYFSDNGRAVIHAIVQCFCGFIGKPLFDIVSTILFVVLLISAFLLCSGNCHHNFCSVVFLCLLLLGTFVTEPVCLYRGISHTTNYLWWASLCLTFLYLFTFVGNHNVKCIIYSTVIYIYTFITGWGHESYSIAIGGGLFVYLLLNRKEITKQQFGMFLSFAIGSAFCVFSPANFHRSESQSISSFNDTLVSFLQKEPCLLVLLLGIIIWQIVIHSQNRTLQKWIEEESFWIGSIIFSVAFIFVCRIIKGRTLFVFELFSVLFIVRSILQLFNEKVITYLGRISAIIVLVFMMIIVHFQALAGAQYYEINRTIDNLSDEDFIVSVPRADHPDYLSKFVSPFIYIDFMTDDWVKDDYEYKMYSWKSRRKSLLFIDKDFNRFLRARFANPDMVSADGTLFRYGKWMISSKKAEQVTLSLKLGDIHPKTLLGCVKWSINKMHLRRLSDQMEYVQPMKCLSVGNDSIYYFDWNNNPEREVLSINVIQ